MFNKALRCTQKAKVRGLLYNYTTFVYVPPRLNMTNIKRRGSVRKMVFITNLRGFVQPSVPFQIDNFNIYSQVLFSFCIDISVCFVCFFLVLSFNIEGPVVNANSVL